MQVATEQNLAPLRPLRPLRSPKVAVVARGSTPAQCLRRRCLGVTPRACAAGRIQPVGAVARRRTEGAVESLVFVHHFRIVVRIVSYLQGINTLFTWPPANAANFGSRREGFPGWGGEMCHPMKPYRQRHFTSLQAGSQINPHRPRRRIFLLLPPRPAGITHHSLKPYRQRHSSSGREPRTPRRPRRR